MNDKLADAPHIWKPPFRWDDFDGVCRDADNWAVPVRELTELLIVALRRSQPEGMVMGMRVVVNHDVPADEVWITDAHGKRLGTIVNLSTAEGKP